MQTFLPFKSFKTTAEILDSRRLNKQILEAYQILKVLSNMSPTGGWRNHPAVKMWRGHEHSLYQYAMTMVAEANSRGIKTDKNVENIETLRAVAGKEWGFNKPEWFGNDAIMLKVTTTHRANLYKKDPEYYACFNMAVHDVNNQPCCEKCSYYWVTHKELANA